VRYSTNKKNAHLKKN